MIAQNVEINFGGPGEHSGAPCAAAPLWAAYIALVNQLIKQTDPAAGLASSVNPTLYDIGLTRGAAVDLYAACFNDIADGGSNANGFPGGITGLNLGFTSVPGYDLCTGLGSPKPGLITQLGSPTPLDAAFREIRFHHRHRRRRPARQRRIRLRLRRERLYGRRVLAGRRSVDLHPQAARHR